MGRDFKDRLQHAAQAADSFVRKTWHPETAARQVAARDAAAAEEEKRRLEEERRRWEERQVYLQLISSQVTGVTTSELPPLLVDPSTPNRAVFFVTVPIAYGAFELSRGSYNILAKHVGMSLGSVSHWALCVVDRGFGPCYAYDLMSDQLILAMLGKNYLRIYEVEPDFVQSWTSCCYVGETTKTHEQIQEIGGRFMSSHPRYHLLDTNCQHLVDALVKELCEGAHVSQAKLSEELSLISPRIAMDLMVARFKSKMDDLKQHEDSDDVKEDMDIIKKLWHKNKTHK